MLKKKFIFVSMIIILGLVTLGSQLVDYVDARNKDFYFEIRQNQNLFGRVYEEISTRYVEIIEPSKFIRAGINGMLSELDPYTVFIEKDDSAELQILTKGKYGGLGMRIVKREGFPTLIEPPMSNTPAEKAGIREGDQIVEINGTSTRQLSVSETAMRLRGKPGSKVTIKIKRAGEPEPIEFHLIRALIEVKDITYKGILQDSIGYIQLSHFSKDAGNEVRQAIEALKAQGMKRMIFDLRSNPGGLLESAVEVTENFLKKGELIVSTKGRMKSANQEYHAKHAASWAEAPLVVLVDGASASASEIASGAIQDLDRGIIIGTPTFGKGLVQTVVHLGDADLKLTTAKYYTPSGRLIQKSDYFKKDGNGIFYELADSSQQSDEEKENPESNKPFSTRNQRKVYQGNGIKPDLEVKGTQFNPYRTALERKSMLFGFAVQYSAENPNLPLDFEVTKEILDAFRKYLQDKEFDYKPSGITYLEKFEKSVKEDDGYDELKVHLAAIEKIMNSKKASAFDENLDYIKFRLKAEIAAKIGGTKAKVEATFDSDPVLRKALQTLTDDKTYYTILNRK